MTIATVAGIACPSCGRNYEPSAKREGRTIKCWCGESIHFPSAAGRGESRDEEDGLAAFRHEGMTVRGWLVRFVFGLVICGVISIPLSLVGFRMHYFANMRALPKREKRKVYAWTLSMVATVALAVSIPLWLGVKFEGLSSEELRMMLGVMLGGTLLAMVIAIAHPALGLVGPVLVAGACYFTGQNLLQVRQHMTASLGAHVEQYAGIMPGDWSEIGHTTIPLKGKVVMVVRETAQLDAMQYLLPASVQARDASEVGTVAWMKWGSHAVGTYPGHRGRAMRRFVDVTFIGLADQKHIAFTKRFYGGDPPTKGADEDLYGSLPTDDIVDFLQTSFGTQ